MARHSINFTQQQQQHDAEQASRYCAAPPSLLTVCVALVALTCTMALQACCRMQVNHVGCRTLASMRQPSQPQIFSASSGVCPSDVLLVEQMVKVRTGGLHVSCYCTNPTTPAKRVSRLSVHDVIEAQVATGRGLAVQRPYLQQVELSAGLSPRAVQADKRSAASAGRGGSSGQLGRRLCGPRRRTATSWPLPSV